MGPLAPADAERVLSFAAWIAEDGARHDATEVMRAVSELVPCDVVEYCGDTTSASDVDAGQFEPGFESYPTVRFAPIDHAVLAESDRCDPVKLHRARTGALGALRLSDLVADVHRHWHEPENLAVTRHLQEQYGEYLPFLVTLRVPCGSAVQSAFSVVRGTSDFTDREVALFDALRPFLALHERLSRARRHHMMHAATSPLSAREEEVLDHLASGRTNRQIAAVMCISPATVRTHLQHIFEKLDVSTRTAALARSGRTLT